MSPHELRALLIIEEGEPFEDGWYEDGDGESGPMGGTTFGYRHGDDEVELTSNGSVLLWTKVRKEPEDALAPVVIYNSSSVATPETWYTGIGAMIKDHLTAIERNANRNGLEFVKTGKRPTSGEYSLDAIMAREAKMRAA